MSAFDVIFYIVAPIVTLIFVVRGINKSEAEKKAAAQRANQPQEESEHESKKQKRKSYQNSNPTQEFNYDSPTEPEQAPIEIDLRQAIIYSEIIKPKYF